MSAAVAKAAGAAVERALFTPFKLRGITIPSRVVMSPM